MSSPKPQTDAALEAALAERDAALTALARVQAELDELRLFILSSDEPEPPNYPATAEPGNPPLRYVLVDEVHAAVKNSAVLSSIRRLLHREDKSRP